jgi:hypothetical protein
MDPSSAGPITGAMAWLLSTFPIARSTAAGTAQPVTRPPTRFDAPVEAAIASAGMSPADSTLAATGGAVPATRRKISSSGAPKRQANATQSPMARFLMFIEDD